MLSVKEVEKIIKEYVDFSVFGNYTFIPAEYLRIVVYDDIMTKLNVGFRLFCQHSANYDTTKCSHHLGSSLLDRLNNIVIFGDEGGMLIPMEICDNKNDLVSYLKNLIENKLKTAKKRRDVVNVFMEVPQIYTPWKIEDDGDGVIITWWLYEASHIDFRHHPGSFLDILFSLCEHKIDQESCEICLKIQNVDDLIGIHSLLAN